MARYGIPGPEGASSCLEDMDFGTTPRFRNLAPHPVGFVCWEKIVPHAPASQTVLTLQRLTPPGAPRTFGKLLAQDGHRLCYTLEDEVRELFGEPVANWKIKGATAIPEGRYRVTLEYSPRFGPDTLTVHDVPGFERIRMHAGNTEADTQGCPLLGLEIDGSGILGGTSRPAVVLVKHFVQNALAHGDTVRLDVVNAIALA